MRLSTFIIEQTEKGSNKILETIQGSESQRFSRVQYTLAIWLNEGRAYLPAMLDETERALWLSNKGFSMTFLMTESLFDLSGVKLVRHP